MERKTEEADLSLFFHFFKVRNQIQVQNLLPFFFVQAVEQIKIHIICLKTIQLFLEQAFCIIQGFYVPDRKLRCQVEFTAVIFF